MIKKKTATKEIVQHQGWLWKRGEGYEGEDVPSGPGGTGGEKEKANSGTLKRVFFKDANKAGSTTAATTTAAATTASSAGSPTNALLKVAALGSGAKQGPEGDTNTEMLLSGIERMLRGKGEKRRFFKLVTIEERMAVGQDASTSLSHGATASMSMSNYRSGRPSDLYDVKVELRYYSKEAADANSLKGVVTLSADCELVIKSDDANFKLVTPGRCYYLRPDGDATSASAITAAFQWGDAIRREVRGLWALQQVLTRQASQSMMMNSSEGASSPAPSAMSPGGRRMFRAESALNFEAESIPSTLADVLANPKSRLDFKQFLETALANENLEFYEAVEQLPLVADKPAKGREIIAQFVVPGSSSEVNLSSAQRNALLKVKDEPKLSDFDDAKAEIFKLMEDNFFKRFYREAMEKTGAFAALYATLGIDGFNAVLQHFGPVKTDLARTLLTFKSRLKRAESSIDQIRKELSSSSREVSVAHQTSSRRALIATYRTTIVRLEALVDFADEMRNQVVQPLEQLMDKVEHDILAIHQSVRESVTDLEECRKLIQASTADYERAKASNAPNVEHLKQALAECEVALENAETFHSKPIEAAMAKLESLELYRIETQRQIIRYAMIAEKNMMEELRAASHLFNMASKTIEIDLDVKELTLGITKELHSGQA